MKASELLLTSRKISNAYISGGKDLNSSIAKIASEQNLSKCHIERLVEECNKATFLNLLEKKGEQEFPVASYDEIKKILIPTIEKKASNIPNFDKITYSDSLFKESIGNVDKPTIIEKQASDLCFSEEGKVYFEALLKIANEFTLNYNDLLNLESLAFKRYGFAKDMMKTAELNKDNEILQIRDVENNLEKQAKLFELVLEKSAGSLFFGETNPIKAAMNAGGGPIKRVAHGAGAVLNLATKTAVGVPASAIGGAGKLAVKGAAYIAPVAVPFVASTAVKNLGTTLTLATEGKKAINVARNGIRSQNLVGPGAHLIDKVAMEKNAFLGEILPVATKLFETPFVQNALKWGGRAMTAKSAVDSVTKNAVKSIGPGMIATASENEMKKEASISSGLQHTLEFIEPALTFGSKFTPLGILAGITATAAKKMGGGIALTMNKKEFENSFDTIMKNNPDFSPNKDQIRGYFDVVSRHAPSLAKDPLVAESIVKNMNAFGGVDYNTIRGLRETESLGERGSDKKVKSFSF